MWIATSRKKTSKKWKNEDISWESFCTRLQTPLRTPETTAEYLHMGKEDRDKAKEAPGGFVGGYLTDGIRKSEAVRERSLITIDADRGRVNQWASFTAIYDDFAVACYSTHSHTASKPRMRWIIPTTRPMTPDEYPAVARRVAEWIGLDTVDASSFRLCQLMYWPSCPLDGDYEYHIQLGDYLDPDYVLSTYTDWRDTNEWPVTIDEDIAKISKGKSQENPVEKKGIVGLFCRAYDVHRAIHELIPEAYTDTDDPNRYTYANGTSYGGAHVYDDGNFLFSHHATDPCSGRLVNAWDLVRIHKFGYLDDETGEDTFDHKLKSYHAMSEWASNLPDIKSQVVAEKNAQFEDEFGDIIELSSTDWSEGLVVNVKTGECDPTIENACLILMNDPKLKDKFGFDMFSESPMKLGSLPWDTSDRVREWKDDDDSGLRWYMEKKWKLVSKDRIYDALSICMNKNAFHPLQDYLNGLEWDGAERLDAMFVDYLGAEDSAYVRAVTRKWMCGAVKRALHPGCKFDEAIVLVGEQGLGKSMFAQIISKGWFNDSIVDMNNKDGYDSLHGAWIIELAELASTKRSDVETVKTFLSKNEDTYRSAYSRRKATHKRQCVFFGTTNEVEFLRDRSGNRRFWPITVHKFVDMEKLRKNIDQIWAEAKQRLADGETLWLDTDELKAEWEENLAPHQVQDELEGLILDYLDTPLPDNWEDLSVESRKDFIQGDLFPMIDASACHLRRDTICLTEIRYELLGEELTRNGGHDLTSRRIANIINNTKSWRKSPRKIYRKPYGQQWVYERTSYSKKQWAEDHNLNDDSDENTEQDWMS